MPEALAPFLIHLPAWEALREAVASGTVPEDMRAAIERSAASAAAAPIRTLVDRPDQPLRPTDDPHAYASIGTYFHPNPDTPDGMPWVSRDGEFSPVFHQYDRPLWDHTADTVKTLGEAAYLLDRQDLADRAAEHLHAWMVDPATRMRPDVLHGQFVPGQCAGRWVGVIDFSTRMPAMLDAVRLVWDHLPDDVQAGVRQWCSLFLHWLVEGPYAADLTDPRQNNHGTFYDRLIVYLALWLGREEIARSRLARFVPDRLMTQITDDGTQPHETRRTLSWNYTVMNTIGLIGVAQLADALGPLPLRAGQPGHDRLRSAVAFLAPYLVGEKEWTWKQIKPIQPLRAWPLVAAADRWLGSDGLWQRWCDHVSLQRTPWLEAWLAFTLDGHPIRK